MNILYISPYRNSHTYNECINNIKALKGSGSLTICPIYIDSEILDPEQDILPLELNKLCSQDYDLVIQHAPVDYLIPFSNIVKKNYCIPIIKYAKNISQKYFSRLSNFDMILSDSKYDADFITNAIGNKDKKIKLFNYTNYYDSDKQFNLSYHNRNYKLYTFINQKNIHLVNKIFVSFFLAYQEISDCSLILAVESDATASKIKSVLDDLIKKIKSNNIQNYIKIIVIPQHIDSILAIHKTCDCYIEFRETTNSHFHNFIAKEYNNTFITNENLDLYYEPSIVNEDDSFGNLYPAFSSSALAAKIKSVIRTKPIHKTDNIPTLDKIVCK